MARNIDEVYWNIDEIKWNIDETDRNIDEMYLRKQWSDVQENW